MEEHYRIFQYKLSFITLRRVVEFHESAASAGLNQHLFDPVSTNTEHSGHHKAGIFGRAASLESVCFQRPTHKDLLYHLVHKKWIPEQWKK